MGLVCLYDVIGFADVVMIVDFFMFVDEHFSGLNVGCTDSWSDGRKLTPTVTPHILPKIQVGLSVYKGVWELSLGKGFMKRRSLES